jgi:HSP20 family protein
MNLTLRRPSLLTNFFSEAPFFGNLIDLDEDFLSPQSKLPLANVTETEKDYQIELAVPGLTRKDIKVEMDNDLLTVSAEKEEKSEEKEKKNGKITRKEYSYESFSRSFRMPEHCKSDKIEAKYDNGVLKVSVPKKEVTVSKQKKEIAVS